MVRFSDECIKIYLLARLDAGIRDEINGGHFQDVEGAFSRIQIYMEEHPDELNAEEYAELYNETMLFKAMAIGEDGALDFDSAEQMLEYAKKCDDTEIRELLAMDGIPCCEEMHSGEFLEYREARKKRWENGFKLTEEIYFQKPPVCEVKRKSSFLLLR